MSDLLYPERLKEIMKRTGSSAYESYQLAEGLLKAKEELLRKDAEIANLKKHLTDCTDWMERGRVSGDCGNWDWDETSEYTQAINTLKGSTHEC